jgi:large conductance mechanosensitive channel
MSMLQEFKTFAVKGNVLDLAVGVIIGAAFGTIVTSLVGDIVMPVLGIFTGGIDFSGLAATVGSANVAYGKFIQAVFVFCLTAFALFLIIKGANTLKRQKEEKPVPPPGPTKEEILLTEIRDELRARPR